MRTVLGTAALMLILGGCTWRAAPVLVAEQWSAIQSRMHSLDGQPIAESPPRRRSDAWEASAIYDFPSDPATTALHVRSALPPGYVVIDQRPERTDYARTIAGDSLYLTIAFEAKPARHTLVTITWRSLPS